MSNVQTVAKKTVDGKKVVVVVPQILTSSDGPVDFEFPERVEAPLSPRTLAKMAEADPREWARQDREKQQLHAKRHKLSKNPFPKQHSKIDYSLLMSAQFDPTAEGKTHTSPRGRQQQQQTKHSPRTKKMGSMSTLDLDLSVDTSVDISADFAAGDFSQQRSRSLSPQRQSQTFPLTVAAAQLESTPPLSLFTSLSSIEYHLHDIGKTKKAMAETVAALGRTNSFKLEGKHVRSSMAISSKKEMERRLEVALQVAEKQKKEMQSLRTDIQRTWSDLSLHLRPNPSSLPPSPSKDTVTSSLRSTGALSTSHTATTAAAAALASSTAAEEADSNMYEEIKNLRESLDARVRLVPTSSEKQQQLKCKRQSSLGSLQKRPVAANKSSGSDTKLLIMLKPIGDTSSP